MMSSTNLDLDNPNPLDPAVASSTGLERKKYGLLNDAEVEGLSAGLLALYQPDLEHVKQQLNELTKKQQMLVEQLCCENERLELSHTQFGMQDTFSKVKVYHTKLVALRKDMQQLHERSTKLKKRGLRLQEQRQKEALQRELSRERELQREQKLIQQAVPSSSNQGN